MSAWIEDSFSIVLPTLNESDNILPMMEALDRLYPNAGIIVVDDHSKDGTADIAIEYGKRRGKVQVVQRDPNDRGLTASIADGIMHADTKYFVVLDADFQHPPESIAGLIQELINGNDMAIGVREDKIELSFTRKWASIAAHRMAVSYLYARRQPTTKDTMSGFFAGRCDLCQKVIGEKGSKFERAGFKALFDLLKFMPRDIRIAEVSFKFNSRRAGESKLNSRVILSIMRQCGIGGKALAYTSMFFLTNMMGRFIAALGLGLLFTFWFLGWIGVGIAWNSNLIIATIASLILAVGYIVFANKVMFTHGSRKGLLLGAKLVATGFSGYLISLYIFYIAFSTVTEIQMVSIFFGFGIGYSFDALGASIRA
ncbi:MAG: glycosyltransferase [Methanomassiliicoccales archaeon]